MINDRTSKAHPATRLALAAIAVCALVGGNAACGNDEGDDADLTIYSGRSEDFMGPLLDRFEAAAGIEVEVRYGETAELAATLIEEGENTPADVFLSQDAGALGALSEEGLLTRLDGATLGLVDKPFRAPDGTWVGTTGRARTVGYDSRVVEQSELPASVLDFTDPEWKGRVGWAPTNASFQTFVTALRLTQGEDAAREWLEGMVANDAVTYADNIALRDAIAAGEVEVGLLNHYYVAEAIEEEGTGYPVALYFPPNGDIGSLVNVAGAGILAGADGAQTAAELIEFMLSQSEQEYFTDVIKEYPLVKGVKPDPALIPLAEIEQPDVNLTDLSDLATTLTLLEETGAL